MSRRRGSGGFSVALLGPDGSGKSTISEHLQNTWPAPVRVIYMGVSAESSNVMLPTTRLIRTLRRWRARRSGRPITNTTSPGPTSSGGIREWLRLLHLTLDEWYRHGVAWYHMRRGRLVVFDRHYLADYFHHHVAPVDGARRSLPVRLHGWQLTRLLPRPDLVIALDASIEDLTNRKQEDSAAWLSRRRNEYADIGHLFPNLVRIDVSRPLEAVLSDVENRIEAFAADRPRGGQ